jgi:hypothetical protein
MMLAIGLFGGFCGLCFLVRCHALRVFTKRAGARRGRSVGEQRGACAHVRATARTRRSATLSYELISTIGLKPPKIIRLASNGMLLGRCARIRGSFMTFLFTSSRCLRDL